MQCNKMKGDKFLLLPSALHASPNKPASQSVSQSVSQSDSQSVSQSVSHHIGRSVRRLVSLSVCLSVGLSVRQMNVRIMNVTVVFVTDLLEKLNIQLIIFNYFLCLSGQMSWSPFRYIQVRLILTEHLRIAYQTVLKTTGLERQHFLNFCPLFDCQMGLSETCNRRKCFINS